MTQLYIGSKSQNNWNSLQGDYRWWCFDCLKIDWLIGALLAISWRPVLIGCQWGSRSAQREPPTVHFYILRLSFLHFSLNILALSVFLSDLYIFVYAILFCLHYTFLFTLYNFVNATQWDTFLFMLYIFVYAIHFCLRYTCLFMLYKLYILFTRKDKIPSGQ